MQDKSINNALLALRKQMIREGGDGLSHVEALLQMRGVAMPAVLPAKTDAAGKGRMAWMLMEALRERPMTQREAAAYVLERRPELSPEAAYKRAALGLARLKRRGALAREGRVWKLAP